MLYCVGFEIAKLNNSHTQQLWLLIQAIRITAGKHWRHVIFMRRYVAHDLSTALWNKKEIQPV
jgi:hypothetical protein